METGSVSSKAWLHAYGCFIVGTRYATPGSGCGCEDRGPNWHHRNAMDGLVRGEARQTSVITVGAKVCCCNPCWTQSMTATSYLVLRTTYIDTLQGSPPALHEPQLSCLRSLVTLSSTHSWADRPVWWKPL